jgi:hypothetical protein
MDESHVRLRAVRRSKRGRAAFSHCIGDLRWLRQLRYTSCESVIASRTTDKDEEVYPAGTKRNGLSSDLNKLTVVKI